MSRASLSLAFAALLPLATSFAQPARPMPSDSLARALPADPAVRIGTLANGLRYYVRANAEPKARAELRLVVRAGSVLEDEDQRGLAHLLEHMAFNGTEHFKRNALVSYLERVGMRFGPDINASTGFDETIYMLQIPTDRAAVVDTAMQILEDWARSVTLDSAEIAKERGVVTEEWRLGRGAQARIQDEQFPVLLGGSRYAARLPIGDTAIIAHAPPAAVQRFYHDWYRPDLMAVVAVGDFDAATVERKIRQTFADVPRPPRERPRPSFGIPDHDTARVVVSSDREATGSGVVVYVKRPERSDSTYGDYRREIVASLFTRMLDQRLYEITRRPDAPFIGASASQGHFLGDKDAFVLGASVKDGGIVRGLEAVLTEMERVRRHGFTATELERARQNLVRAYERAYAEREKTASGALADEYVSNFTDGAPIPGIAVEYRLAERFAPGITLDEVNRVAQEWTGPRGRVITASAPAKPGLALPTGAELLAVAREVGARDVAAYVDEGASGSLVEHAPTPGSITKRETIPPIGVTTWTLSNGARVILKPTDFKADQVLLRAFAPGGTSLLGDSLFPKARAAATLVAQGGVGRFDRIALEKALAGKAAGASPYIAELEQGVSAQASPRDLETMFQLVHLYFTAPRADSAAVLSFKQRQKDAIANRGASPEAAFFDTVQVTLTQHAPRTLPVTAATFDSLDLGASLAFYRERFADAGAFTFVIVGNVSPDSLEPLVRTYLASLPSTGRNARWRDIGVRPPSGVVQREVHRGTEPKAFTEIVFTGPFEWTRESRYALSSLAEVMRIRLRDVLREALGGTYDVEVDGEPERDPVPQYSVSIFYGSAPDRAESLERAVFAQIDSLAKRGPTAQELEKVREIQRREQETRLRENGFWLDALVFAADYGEDPRLIPDRDSLIRTLDAAMIERAASRWLDRGRYVSVRLVPQK
jgi:zinc protease